MQEAIDCSNFGAAKKRDGVVPCSKSMCLMLQEAKTQNVKVGKGLLILKAPTKKMGALAVPHIHVQKVQTAGFFYAMGREVGVVRGDWPWQTSGWPRGLRKIVLIDVSQSKFLQTFANHFILPSSPRATSRIPLMLSLSVRETERKP